MKRRLLAALALSALAVALFATAGVRAVPLAPSPDVAHAAAFVAPAADALRVTTRTVWYDVRGATEDELSHQVQALGPRDGAGAWGASTAWHFTWTFERMPTSAGCSAADPHVDLLVTFTYPRWTPPTGSAAELVDVWQRYLDAATVHEQGHADLATSAGSELVLALRQAPPAAACEGLDDVADDVAERVLASHAISQMLYDVQTDHGQTQGATFP